MADLVTYRHVWTYRYLGVIPVLTYRLAEAIDALGKLARKAERYGTAPITWTVGEEYMETYKDAEGRKHTVSYTDLALKGLEAPRVGDYTFLAKAEITEGGVIIDTVPGVVLPAGSRERLGTGECEHCRNKRARKDVFLVRDPEGVIVQVGRTCLRDYMGTDTPTSVAARFRFEQELKGFDEEFGGYGKRLPDSALELLAVTACAIRLWGWVPKSAPESAGEPTAFRVASWFYAPASDKAAQADKKALEGAIADRDWETAQAAMDWVLDGDSGDSEYMENLRVILRPGAVDAKRRGYACSAVAAYQRHLGKLEQAKRERETAAASGSGRKASASRG